MTIPNTWRLALTRPRRANIFRRLWMWWRMGRFRTERHFTEER
jgi:hypothetical protein